jgi:hypothetical protein
MEYKSRGEVMSEYPSFLAYLALEEDPDNALAYFSEETNVNFTDYKQSEEYDKVMIEEWD